MYGIFDAKLAASRKTAMDVSSAPNFVSAFMDFQWNEASGTSPGARILSRLLCGVLAGIRVAEERGDLRKRLRILDELGVIVIGVISF
jgi:hypothetical protein